MAPVQNKRRRSEDGVRRPNKKFKKVKRQAEYHSSSEAEDARSGANAVEVKQRLPVAPSPKPILKHTIPAAALEPNTERENHGGNTDDVVTRNTALNLAQEQSSDDDLEVDEAGVDAPETDAASASEEEDEEDSEAETSSLTSSNAARAKKKRNDPLAFATSISKILDTKLSKAKRQDPVLSRSKSAVEANRSLADSKLEQKARAQIRAERKQALDKGRVEDVLGLETPAVDTGALLEEEKMLKKTAQRGVVKLFNAVRAAQVKAEVAIKQARQEGVVGMQNREERVNEMSKQGFLDLISSGGKQSTAAT